MKTTGGYKGYKEAATEAFSAIIPIPAIKYSPEYGFYVESDLTPTDEGDVNLGPVFYSLNNNGNKSEGGRSNYIRAKAKIISELKGLDAEMQFMREHEEIFF